MVDRDDASLGEVATRDGRGRTVRRWWRSSLATQAIALQIVVIAVVVLAGSGLALLDARTRRRRRRTPAGRRHRDRAGRLAVDGGGDRIRKGHRDFAAGNRGRPHQHRHRVHHDHVARRNALHPHRSAPDRRPLPRHHRARAARRDIHRGVHRHARPVDPDHRAGARRLRQDRRPGVGGHHCSRPWPNAGDRNGRPSRRSALRRWRFRWSECGRSGAGCCGRRTGCDPTSCG